MLIHFKVFNQTFSYISKSFHIHFKSNTFQMSMLLKELMPPSIILVHGESKGMGKIVTKWKLEKGGGNGLLSDKITCNIMVDGFCKEGQLNLAFNIFNPMNSVGLELDGFIFTTLIGDFYKLGRLEHANKNNFNLIFGLVLVFSKK